MAVTDPGQRIATPLETVPSHELMVYLERYFRSEEVEMLVVGHPRKPDSSDSENMKLVRFFVSAFRKRFTSVPVAWEDERYTSRMARESLVESGMKKSRRSGKAQVDMVSAALILQTYLERRNNKGKKMLSD